MVDANAAAFVIYAETQTVMLSFVPSHELTEDGSLVEDECPKLGTQLLVALPVYSHADVLVVYGSRLTGVAELVEIADPLTVHSSRVTASAALLRAGAVRVLFVKVSVAVRSTTVSGPPRVTN
jgi:hypothetical protein